MGPAEGHIIRQEPKILKQSMEGDLYGFKDRFTLLNSISSTNRR